MLFLPVSWLAWMSVVLADTTFFSPPDAKLQENYRDNPVYQINEPIKLNWLTSEKSVNLMLLMTAEGSRSRFPLAIATNIFDTGYEWKLTRHLDPFIDDELDRIGQVVLYFRLFTTQETGTTTLTTSHSVNITTPASTKLSSSSTSSTTLLSSTTTISLPTTASPLPTGTADDKPSAGVIGGAVGGTIGGLLVVGIIGAILWKRLRKPAPKLTANESEVYYSMPAAVETNLAESRK